MKAHKNKVGFYSKKGHAAIVAYPKGSMILNKHDNIRLFSDKYIINFPISVRKYEGNDCNDLINYRTGSAIKG